MDIVNIAAYKFVSISNRHELQSILKERCCQLNLKGSIVLAEEGINLFLAGANDAIEAFLKFLREDAVFEQRFADLKVKCSLSAKQPFKKMIVRLPKEIITMRCPTIRPEDGRAPAVEPAKLKDWLEHGCDDDGREIIMIDTRNDYEVAVGTFDGAVDFKLANFSEFSDAMRKMAQSDVLEGKTIVTYCTGGIRCEKAALFMNDDLQLKNVFQLEGGILNYFEAVGADHWHGECFVFDQRDAVDAQLRPTTQFICGGSNKETI